jgi:glucoside 3-dehydrogenase (cytochrome c) catalytic subunit
MTLLRAEAPRPGEVDLSHHYDAVIVGSGAAGGMAAHVLTSKGLDVLLLEAGKKLDIENELRSMEWPYDHPRRGEMPYTSHALSQNEYNLRTPPYAKGLPWKTVYSYVQEWNGSDYSKNILVNEQDHPYTGTRYAWVRARALGGKTNIWGRLALRLSDYDFKAKSHDGYGEDWPLSYADIEPYYDKVDLYLGISGHPEGLAHLPDSRFQRATRLNAAEVRLRQSLGQSGRVLTPYRAGVTTDGLKHNKYRSRCYGRGACNRRAGGCDIHAAFDSPTGLIYPAMDTGRLTLRTGSIAREVSVDPVTGKARGVAFVDMATGRSLEARAKVVVLAASTLESARLMLLSRSTRYPDGIGNSSGHVGHNFCEHVMGPSVGGYFKDLVGKPRTLDDGRPGGFYVARFRNLKERDPNFIRGYGFEGSSGTSMFPHTTGAPGFGKEYKKTVRELAGATIGMGGFGEVLARYENAVAIDPDVVDKWGIPVLRFSFKFGDNEKKMCADMAVQAKQIFEEAGIEVLQSDGDMLTEGWSIHELGTARMGNDPKTSVLNQYQQSHDVKNLFVVDGSSHVNASCQNPTWTIMALAWRSCDYLADQLGKGAL